MRKVKRIRISIRKRVGRAVKDEGIFFYDIKSILLSYS